MNPRNAYAVTTPAGDYAPACDRVISWHRSYTAAARVAARCRRNGIGPVAVTPAERVREYQSPLCAAL